jgi:hypothetical protein
VSLLFKPDFERGTSEIVEPLVRPSKPVRFVVPDDAKVSCQKADACTSPSKRRLSFVCGSSYSHVDRCSSCVEYLRLSRGISGRGGHLI